MSGPFYKLQRATTRCTSSRCPGLLSIVGFCTAHIAAATPDERADLLLLITGHSAVAVLQTLGMLSRSCACQPASLTGSRTTRTRPLRLHINSPRSRSRDVAAMAFPFSRKIAKLQQNFNSAGINLFLQIVGSNHSLALPHISVPDIRHVDWEALAAAGYKGCIFDKDNTICRPFALEVDAALQDSMDRCKAAFSGKIVLFSNSAGGLL